MELVAALRSGKYAQTTGRLKDIDGGYCCLGVACDISKVGKWASENETIAGTYYLDCDTDLPLKVREYFGFHSASGLIANLTEDIEIIDEDDEDNIIVGDNLIDLNDNGATFNQIADIIEKHWKDL